MKEHDIDQLFSQGLESSTMPFDDAAWESAEKAIIAHEARKRRRAIIIWLFAGLIMISGALGTYNYITLPANKAAVQIKTDNEPIKPSNGEKTALTQTDSGSANDSDKIEEGEELNSGSMPSKSFRSNLTQQSNGIIEKPPILISIADESEKAEPHNSEIAERPISTVASGEAPGIALMAVKHAGLLSLADAEAVDPKLLEYVAKIPLPDHWNTRLNIIAGITPLEYVQRSEANRSNAPYYAGIGISRIRSYSMEIGAAIIYEEMLLSPNSENIEQVEYSFTRKTTTHLIQRNRSAYLSLPVYIKYRLKRNHALSFGLQYSRLMQSYSNYSVVQTTENSIIDLSKENSAAGFNNDLNRNQFSTLLGYNLTLTDRLQFHIQGRFGIHSPFKENIRPSAFSDRIHLRVGLEYSIWRR